MTTSFLKPRANSPLNVVWREGLITGESCDQLVAYCETLPVLDAVLTGPQVPEARQSTIAWVPQQKDSAPLFDLVRTQAEELNAEHFGFDLVGFGERMQYARYGTGKGHYDWHIDVGPGANSLRKLSIIIQLSDEADYEGGDVEFQAPGPITRLPRKRGTLAVFSPFLLHRVTQVTRGERRSLVAWISGPPFR